MTRYRTIVADPPWAYAGMSDPWRSSVEAHYPLMDVDEIKDIPVNEWAEPSAHLYLWAVLPLVGQAYEVVRAWGFKRSTMVTWCKPGPGLGGGWRGNTEHLLVARRGVAPFASVGEGTWFQASRNGHSRKPDLFADWIERLSPGPYLELFARRQRLGWDTWGDEALCHVDMGETA